ncbi:hypothetical protein HWV62_13701 [Athelia sp. TMB]|nr:hypothetical protein HWV62_13701 [Athelia sp. TMB]
MDLCTYNQLLSDPALNNQLLSDQLRALGLYAAPTLGDGNCLFRALADQLHGSPAAHAQLRADICEWIEDHKERYAPFCEDERGLDAHLACMKEMATYGGHLELSAFAHLTRRNVKVIQPGLVYVIEWAAGGADDDRERRRLRRDHKRTEYEEEVEEEAGPVYVAYHDWEHFSSIRNLKGPHAGLPCVVEAPEDAPPPSPPKPKPKSAARAKREPKPKSKGKTKRESKSVTPAPAPPTPSAIPLPPSRSPSPPPSEFDPVFRADLIPPTPNLPHPAEAPAILSAHALHLDQLRAHAHNSPKRALEFDESSASSSASKRRRAPGLSAPDSSGSAGSSALSSALSSPASSPPVSAPAPEEKPRELTRRQRKALGLPKPRAVLVGKGSAGKIKIPGGKHSSRAHSVKVEDNAAEEEGDNGEWRTNGTGRVDVRGFRELKI